MGYFEDFSKKGIINKIEKYKSPEKLYQISKKLSKVANQRLLTLEKNNITSQAYLRAKTLIEDFTENPFTENKNRKVRFPLRKTYTLDEYKDLIRITSRFLSMETSKPSFAKKAILKTEKALAERFNLETSEEFNTFYDFMNAVKAEKDITEYIPSDIIAAIFTENMDNPLEFSEKIKDIIIDSKYTDKVNRIIEIMYKKNMDNDIFNVIQEISTDRKDFITNLDAYQRQDVEIVKIINDLLG